MKYIIELPEEVKEKFDNAAKDTIYYSYYDYDSVIGNAIKNSTPLSEELKKIRAEIDTARFIDKDTKLCKNANASGLEVAMQIIDEYKAESEKLKGEKL